MLLSTLAIASCRVAAPAVPAPTTAGQTGADDPPNNWQLLDDSIDHFPGVGAERAYRELLARRSPARTVVVAIIDVGIDTMHQDLRANLWTNPREIAGNGIDDDGDGHVDDIRGWNFLGAPDGRNVRYDNLEVTRLYKRCTGHSGKESVPPKSLASGLPSCSDIVLDYQTQRGVEDRHIAQREALLDTLTEAVQQLQRILGTDSVTIASVVSLKLPDGETQRARATFLRARARFGGLRDRPFITMADVAAARLNLRQSPLFLYGLNLSYDPRALIGDHYADTGERDYGNADVMGPDAGHGTHVAGIIGAVRGNGLGVDGIAPAVRLMMVRATSNGDERDKDVANAIRYAVDHGANIINMSFGKPYSPEKAAVDDAVRYADARGVLLVHSAGNDGTDVDRSANYPTRTYIEGGSATAWIEVGASSWRHGDAFVPSFTNYGHEQVDLFAPGVDILSTAAGGGVERRSGTSQATPVVTGVAALIMAYFPRLTAADVKRLLVTSATRYPHLTVKRPGTPDRVAFSALSRSGGVVNAYAAVRLADLWSARR